jgi:hypothetical protein
VFDGTIILYFTGRYFKINAEKRASYTIKRKDEAGMIMESTGNVAL